MAHSKGIFVESEIGHVGSGNLVGVSCSIDDDTIYTSKEEALEFSKLTGTDSLAISIGTVHGSYIGEPKINFEEGIKRFTAWVNAQEVVEDKYEKSIEEMKEKGLYK